MSTSSPDFLLCVCVCVCVCVCWSRWPKNYAIASCYSQLYVLGNSLGHTILSVWISTLLLISKTKYLPAIHLPFSDCINTKTIHWKLSELFINIRTPSIYMLQKAMAPHSSTLAWKIPWAEEPGRLQSMRLLRVGHDWVISLSVFTFMHWRRKWQPTPVFLPGESQGLGNLVGW